MHIAHLLVEWAIGHGSHYFASIFMAYVCLNEMLLKDVCTYGSKIVKEIALNVLKELQIFASPMSLVRNFREILRLIQEKCFFIPSVVRQAVHSCYLNFES